MGRQLERYAHIPVRKEKAASDVEKLRKGARFILSLDENGNYTLEERDEFSANVLAVLASTEVDGVFLEEALILEIGIGKGTPYTHTFRKDTSGQCLSVDRRKTREATSKERAIIWNVFSSLMIRLTDERRSNWANNGKWFGYTESGKSYAYTRGQRFSVSIGDHWIRDFILEAEFSYRWKKYLHKSSHAIWYWLSRHRYTYYSKRQAKAHLGLRKTFDLLGGIHFSHDFLRWRFIESLRPKRAALVRNTAEHFDVPFAETAYSIPRPEPKIPGYHIFINRVDADNRGIVVFECAPDEVPAEEPSTGQKDSGTQSNDSFPDIGEDIPFHPEEYAKCETKTPDDDCPF